MRYVLKAGTIVFSSASPEKILVLYQQKHRDFSFPKGHMEQGETLEQCAVRETKEETGLDVILQDKICETEYHNNTDGFVKLTFFVAKSLDDSKIKTEPGGIVYWMSFDEALEKISYPNLRDVLNKLKENA